MRCEARGRKSLWLLSSLRSWLGLRSWVALLAGHFCFPHAASWWRTELNTQAWAGGTVRPCSAPVFVSVSHAYGTQAIWVPSLPMMTASQQWVRNTTPESFTKPSSFYWKKFTMSRLSRMLFLLLRNINTFSLSIKMPQRNKSFNLLQKQYFTN